MIYNEDSTCFSELEDALKELGVSAESIKFAMAYLDTDNERDNGLLEKIELHDFSQNLYGTKLDALHKLHKAAENEVRKKHDPELLMRYALIAYAIAGSYAEKFYHHKCYIHDVEELQEWFLQALISNYGEDGGLIRYYTILSHAEPRSRYNRDYKFNPEIAVKAALFEKEREPSNVILLCFYALLFTQTDCKEDYVRTATDMIVAYYKSFNKFSEFDLAVLAETSVFSVEAKNLFVKHLNIDQSDVATVAIRYDSIRILDAIADTGNIDSTYISAINNASGFIVDKHLHRLAKEYTNEFIKVLKKERHWLKMRVLRETLATERPDVEVNLDEVKEQFRIEVSESISQLYKNPEMIRAYLLGEKSFDEIYPTIKGFEISDSKQNSYAMIFGCDDFLARCVSVMAPCIGKHNYYCIQNATNINLELCPEQFINMLMKEITSPDVMLDAVSKVIENCYRIDKCISIISTVLENHMDFIKDADASKLSAVGRTLYVYTLGKQPDRYKSKLLPFATDTSKAVRETLIPIFVKANWNDYVCEIIKSKKSAMREFAVSVIEAQGADKYTDVLNEAFAAEKSEKLKKRIAVLIGEKIEEPTTISADDELKKLTSPSKTKKLDWLYNTPFSSVKLTDGSPADDTLLKGLMMCYAAVAGTVNPLAHKIAEKLNKKDLERFACEVFGKWIDDGAAAKLKWVLYFSAVYGGNEMIDSLMHYIKYWSENSRSAIAGEAVKALALNGSSAALMHVDDMSRKFKNRQVKSAANDALLYAAEELGITKEELADRIVPDMGFDEKMCRTFDYGKRQFSVYLTPSLEIEIFCEDKKVKNLPKPGANDDAEIAEKSYADFKEMKKQMKTVVKTQQARLEYVLMCDRKWTCENWKKLFVANPVMHCFAIGLIWGTYKDDRLVSTFRYLDDGSFTTSDEEEFELADDAVIGLIHPIELSEDEKNIWTSQLADYEIVQPFAQLIRPVYRVTDDEAESTKIMRFNGNEIINQTLVNRLAKFGWEKGAAEDAGCFYEFYHYDTTQIKKNADGSKVPVGFTAELKFSGTYIGVFEIEAEEVTIEDLVFHTAAEPYSNPIKCSDVSPRYFSEIIAQLTAAVDTPTK